MGGTLSGVPRKSIYPEVTDQRTLALKLNDDHYNITYGLNRLNHGSRITKSNAVLGVT